MIVLDTTTRKIEVLLGGTITTNQLPVVASYIDYIAGTSFTPATNQTQTNNVTAVTAIGSPAGSAIRQIKFIQVQNADTVSATVTVRYNDNGTTANMVVVTIAKGEQLTYEDGLGWWVVDVNGTNKTTNALSFVSGQITSGYIGNTAITSGSIASGQIGQFATNSGLFTINSGNNYWNYMLNGGMEYFNYGNTNSGVNKNIVIAANASGGDTIGPNGFYGSVSSGTGTTILTAVGNDRTVATQYTSGISSRCYVKWALTGANASGTSYATYQIIRASDSQVLVNKNISFQANLSTTAGGSGAQFLMGILQTNSGATPDVVPNSIISGWTNSGTFPNWGSGVSILSSGTLCTLTPSWTVYNVITQALSGHVNLIPIIWTNGGAISTQPIYMTELGLYED